MLMIIENNVDLGKEIEEEVVLKSICGLEPDKSLGLDGISISFYRHCWNIIKGGL